MALDSLFLIKYVISKSYKLLGNEKIMLKMTYLSRLVFVVRRYDRSL